MNVVPIGPVLGLIVNDAFGGRFACADTTTCRVVVAVAPRLSVTVSRTVCVPAAL